MIGPSTDLHLWAESYDRELADIFSIQSEAAQQIASELKAVVSPDLLERIKAIPFSNIEAYDYYLTGNEAYWRSWKFLDKNIVYESIDYFKIAIALDKNFLRAYTESAVATINWDWDNTATK